MIFLLCNTGWIKPVTSASVLKNFWFNACVSVNRKVEMPTIQWVFAVPRDSSRRFAPLSQRLFSKLPVLSVPTITEKFVFRSGVEG